MTNCDDYNLTHNVATNADKEVTLVWDPDACVWQIQIDATVGKMTRPITQGRTVAEALRAMADVVRVGVDECADPEQSHCWCRAETRGGQDGRVCCRCGDWTSHRHKRGN